MRIPDGSKPPRNKGPNLATWWAFIALAPLATTQASGCLVGTLRILKALEPEEPYEDSKWLQNPECMRGPNLAMVGARCSNSLWRQHGLGRHCWIRSFFVELLEPREPPEPTGWLQNRKEMKDPNLATWWVIIARTPSGDHTSIRWQE